MQLTKSLVKLVHVVLASWAGSAKTEIENSLPKPKTTICNGDRVLAGAEEAWAGGHAVHHRFHLTLLVQHLYMPAYRLDTSTLFPLHIRRENTPLNRVLYCGVQ